jgi:hypothetical protein
MRQLIKSSQLKFDLRSGIRAGFLAGGLLFLVNTAKAEYWASGGEAAPFFLFPAQASSNVGIGSNAAPNYQLHIFSKAAGTEASLGIQGYANRSAFYFLKANGTGSAPTNVGTSDQIGILESRAYSGTGYQAMSAIVFNVDGGFTSGQRPPSMIQFYTNTANGNQTANMLIKNDGKVGIGTTSPSALLNVSTAVAVNADANIARFGNKISTGRTAELSVDYRGTMGDGTMVLREDRAGVDFMTINMLSSVNKVVFPNGNIGIGTNTPQAPLHVKRDNVQSNLVLIQGNAGGNATLKALNLSHGNTPGAGNLGQAVDQDFSMEGPSGLQYPAARFHVGKESDWTGIMGNVDSYLGISTTLDGQITERMRITANGNVGIGTTLPDYKLDLSGNMRIYGNNSNDFTALSLRSGSNGGDKTRLKFTGDNNGDIAEIVSTVTSPASGGGTPTAGTLTFRTRNGPNSGDMRDQMIITESGKFILGGPGANLPMYVFRPTDGSSATNNGNGSSLVVAAGACDNTSTKIGGTLYLRAGGKNANIGNYGNVLIADDGGRVGIANVSPQANLDVGGDAILGSLKTGYTTGAMVAGTYIGYKGLAQLPNKDFALAQYANGVTLLNSPSGINVAVNGVTYLSASAASGLVSNLNMKVNGTLTVGTVVASNWQIQQVPDYVFEKDYKMASLDQVGSFVEKNKHLPEVPSATQMKAEGLDLVKMNLVLLKKVEELTLHAIRQEKAIKKQSEEFAELKRSISRGR